MAKRQQLIVDTKTPASCPGSSSPYVVSYTPSSGGDWTQKGVDIDGEAAYDFSGYSVSSSSDGNVVAIGAIGNDDTGTDAGHVRVYAWSGSAWVQRGGDIGGEHNSDSSGYSVSLSDDGNIVAIGAPDNGESVTLSSSQDYFGDGAGQLLTGHVRIYEYKTITEQQYNDGNTSDTVQAQYIVGGATLPIPIIITGGLSWSASRKFWVQKCADIEGEDYNDKSGWSVSLSGDGSTVAIGAIQADSRGQVRVYATSASSGAGYVWPPTQKGGEVSVWSGKADIDGEDFADNNGWSVSLSSDGNVLAVGALYNGINYAGHVRIYRFKAISYSQFQAGNTADMTGSPGVPVIITGGVTWSGSYDLTKEFWVQEGDDIDGEAAGDYSGVSVSLSDDGTIVAIGAQNNDGTGTNAGHVRVYAWSGSAWVQRGSDIDAEAATDLSGYSVSLSSAGTIVAIGAVWNDGTGSQVGHVRVYAWSGSAWVQRGSDIDGEAANDLSGYSVSLSSDGSKVVIGAPYNDGTGTNAGGHVRIYQIFSPLSPQVGDWAVAEHKEESTGQLLATYTYRVTYILNPDTMVLEFVSATDGYTEFLPCGLCDGTGSPGACGGIAPHVIKRDLGGMFMMLLD